MADAIPSDVGWQQTEPDYVTFAYLLFPCMHAASYALFDGRTVRCTE